MSRVPDHHLTAGPVAHANADIRDALRRHDRQHWRHSYAVLSGAQLQAAADAAWAAIYADGGVRRVSGGAHVAIRVSAEGEITLGEVGSGGNDLTAGTLPAVTFAPLEENALWAVYQPAVGVLQLITPGPDGIDVAYAVPEQYGLGQGPWQVTLRPGSPFES